MSVFNQRRGLMPFEQPENPHMYYLAPNVPRNYPIVQGPFSGMMDAMLWAQGFSALPVRVPRGPFVAFQRGPWA